MGNNILLWKNQFLTDTAKIVAKITENLEALSSLLLKTLGSFDPESSLFTTPLPEQDPVLRLPLK